MEKYRVAVVWQCSGFIEVDANSIEEAMDDVKKHPNNYSLPKDGGDYVDDSFCLATDDVEAMKAICNY